MDTDRRRGQALVELALGMFALALVFSALFAFAAYIVQSLDAQREVRAKAGTRALNASGAGVSHAETRDVPVDELVEKYIFGKPAIKVEENVYFPPLRIDNAEP